MSTDTISPEERRLALLGVSYVYAALARGFTYPDAEPPTDFSSGLNEIDGALGDALRRMAESARAAGPERLKAAYMRILDPRRPPLAMEAECLGLQGTQRSMLLADVMGFYNAFGVTPSNERPDHIACELDFMNLLGVKEAAAIEANNEENARICADARGKFLESHLLKWRELLVAMIRDRSDGGEDDFYLALADALEAVLLEEESPTNE